MRKGKEILNSHEAILGSIYWKDKNGVYLGGNDNAAKAVGLRSQAELIGKTDYDLFPQAIADEYRKNDLYVMNNNISITAEEKSISPDGKTMYQLSSKKPLIDEKGVICGIIGNTIDITAIKNAEKKLIAAREQAKKNKKNKLIAEGLADKAKERADSEAEMRRAVTVLAGSIAHDVRTPITSLFLITDIFKKELTHLADNMSKTATKENIINDEIKLHLENVLGYPAKIQNTLTDMSGFVDVTLKSIRRLVTGTLSYEDFTICEIEHCLYEVISKYPFQVGEEKLLHMIDIENFSFLGCPVLFYRILFNLFNNALEQIRKNKSGAIFINTRRDKNNNLLCIRDTAGGASPDVIAHLFDGYYTTKKEGTGVGLAFCKLTMESFGGDITCHSIEGEYMEFTLSFPALENGD